MRVVGGGSTGPSRHGAASKPARVVQSGHEAPPQPPRQSADGRRAEPDPSPRDRLKAARLPAGFFTRGCRSGSVVAHRASVTCQYQPVVLRTSYSSSPGAGRDSGPAASSPADRRRPRRPPPGSSQCSPPYRCTVAPPPLSVCPSSGTPSRRSRPPHRHGPSAPSRRSATHPAPRPATKPPAPAASLQQDSKYVRPIDSVSTGTKQYCRQLCVCPDLSGYG